MMWFAPWSGNKTEGKTPSRGKDWHSCVCMSQTQPVYDFAHALFKAEKRHFELEFSKKSSFWMNWGQRLKISKTLCVAVGVLAPLASRVLRKYNPFWPDAAQWVFPWSLGYETAISCWVKKHDGFPARFTFLFFFASGFSCQPWQ